VVVPLFFEVSWGSIDSLLNLFAAKISLPSMADLVLYKDRYDYFLPDGMYNHSVATTQLWTVWNRAEKGGKHLMHELGRVNIFTPVLP